MSGAGDTVVAMMISCLASGLSMRLALHIANGAAGIVVSKVGTYPIHRQELIELWRSVRQLTTSSPLYTKEEMKALIDNGKAWTKPLYLQMVALIFCIEGTLRIYKKRHNLGLTSLLD